MTTKYKLGTFLVAITIATGIYMVYSGNTQAKQKAHIDNANSPCQDNLYSTAFPVLGQNDKEVALLQMARMPNSKTCFALIASRDDVSRLTLARLSEDSKFAVEMVRGANMVTTEPLIVAGSGCSRIGVTVFLEDGIVEKNYRTC